MLFTTKTMSEWYSNYRGAVLENILIEEVATDSRRNTRNSLFIPLKGESFDGHEFLEDAINNGAVATFWELDKELPSFLPNNFPVFLVDDSLVALQQLASHYRNQVNPTVIGITGSNGKTTTKDLIGTVLQSHYRTHRTKGNYNNHIGLPLTILSMKRDTEVLVLEMGMNHLGEIELLSKIARPDYAVITNIGESHIEFLGSRNGIAQAKLEILTGLKKTGLLFIDGDEALLTELHSRDNVMSVGFNSNNKYVISHFSSTEADATFQLANQTYKLNLLGRHNVKNASFAILIAHELNVPFEKIKNSLVQLEITGMRFEVTKGINNVTIINDAYNASPTSMKASIDIVRDMDSRYKKVLVLGDMFEMGKHSRKLHQTVADSISDDINAVFTLGNDSKEITDTVRKKDKDIVVKHFSTKEPLIEELQKYLNDQTIILFKASRGMKFESLIEHLIEKSN